MNTEQRAQTIAHACSLIRREARMRMLREHGAPGFREDRYQAVRRIRATVEDDLAATYGLHITPAGRIVALSEYADPEVIA